MVHYRTQIVCRADGRLIREFYYTKRKKAVYPYVFTIRDEFGKAMYRRYSR